MDALWRLGRMAIRFGQPKLAALSYLRQRSINPAPFTWDLATQFSTLLVAQVHASQRIVRSTPSILQSRLHLTEPCLQVRGTIASMHSVITHVGILRLQPIESAETFFATPPRAGCTP